MESLTDDIGPKPKRQKKTDAKDRVCLTEPQAKKIDGWLDQIESRFKGYIKITRSDLVNYALSAMDEILNDVDLEALNVAHYDQVKFMQWALQQVKAAQKNCQPISLKELLTLHAPAVTSSKPKKQRRKKAVREDELSAPAQTENVTSEGDE